MSQRLRFAIWYIPLFFIIFIVIQSLFLGERPHRIQYSEFKQYIAEQKIETCEIGPEDIEGLLKQENGETRRFVTYKVDDPALVVQLREQGIMFTGRKESVWTTAILPWVLPIVFILLIWIFLIRRMGSGQHILSFGRSKAKLYMRAETGETFSDVAGIDEAKAELEEVVEFLKMPARFQRLGGRMPAGVLLVGPPGTGKTLLARAVAGEAGVPFFSISGSAFVEMFVGVGASRVRDLFAQAQRSAPAIIFIDELDALGKTRGSGGYGGHDEREQTLNQLLVELDGFDTRKGVILMAATNRPETLDAALLRPGRFDRQVVLDAPDARGRLDILKVHAKGVTLSPEVDLSAVSRRTVGFVGAELSHVLNEAALLASRRGKEGIELSDIESSVDRVIGGLERTTRVLSEVERSRVAVHEAGHALVAEVVGGAPVHKVSIVPRGVAALGYTLQTPSEDRYVLTQSELELRLQVLLGGRGAEQVVYGDRSTGAQNDLEQATRVVRRMVRNYGMSPALGPVAFDMERRPFFPGPSDEVVDYSGKTAGAIDREVRRIIDEAYDRVIHLLTARKSTLERVSSTLLEQEIIEGDDLRRMVCE